MNNSVQNSIVFYVGHNAKDAKPARKEMLWDAWVIELIQHEERNEKDGRYFGPYILDDTGNRSACHVLGYTAIVLDVDKNAPSLDNIKAAMNTFKFASVLYTTFSSTLEAPRYRIVVPLTGGVLPVEYVKRAITSLAGWLSTPVDSASHSISQMMYFPAYQRERAAAVDFHIVDGPILPVDTLIGYLPAPQSAEIRDHRLNEWRTEAVEGSESDGIPLDELKAVLLRKKSIKAKFSPNKNPSAADIWHAKEDVLAARWPSQSMDKPFDRSEALQALCVHANWVTGSNHDRTLELLSQSPFCGLYDENEWDRRAKQAISNPRFHNDTFYRSPAAPTAAAIQDDRQSTSCEPVYRPAAGVALYDVECQRHEFTGCVYVADRHAVRMPNGELLNPEQFNAKMPGGSWVVSKEKTTRKPFEAFTTSEFMSFPKCDRMTWRPDKQPSEIIEEHGVTMVNNYKPMPGKRSSGDVTPFLDHLKLMLPDAHDREILLSWAAIVVQKPEVKAKWAPVLIGVQGNGKSTIGEVLRYAIGNNNTVKPRADQLGAKFNGWIEGKLLAVVEEVYISQGRREVLDSLKPIITDSSIEVERKGRDAGMIDNYCNLILFSNHQDAIPKTRNDRRYAVFFTAQQEAEDKIRSGMTEQYFKKLYDWLQNEGGYSFVADYLDNYEPSVSIYGEAPETSTTDLAIEASRSPAQQAVIEAVEMEEHGFRGGIILSDALEALFARLGLKLQTLARSKVIRELGYVKHPNLPDGKLRLSTKAVRVYVKNGHPAAMLPDADTLRTSINRLLMAA